MAARSMTVEEAEETLRLLKEHGSAAAAADALGIPRPTMWSRSTRAKQILADPAVVQAAEAAGVADVANVSHFWKITKDEQGNGYSVFVKNPLSGEQRSLVDLVTESITEAANACAPKYPRRPKAKGRNLLVIDLADVHFRKLCVETETGYTYNSEVAKARVLAGTKALLDRATNFDIGRILFVLGNDILHTDNAQNRTTSGTFQDTDGSLFSAFKAADHALVSAVELSAQVADVDLVHCMSNHDWTHGWMLSQTVAAQFLRHPHVHATPYALSEMHRKYYRFGRNLIGLSHGDGAKEEILYGRMVAEARQHISECPHLYWYLHHVHHKDRKRRDGSKPMFREKDHAGMTAVVSGQGAVEGTHVNIEYVRSPSAPDGWHDRNGYVNKQAVEAFVHHPDEGQFARFTEWF